jgi:glycosyltransferase involved in cell wall biosynthesis
MKVALVLLWPLREFYSQELDEMGRIEENWERIVCQKEDVEDRLAKALNDVNITSVLVHLTNAHRVKTHVHRFGHMVIEVPNEVSINVPHFSYNLSITLFRYLCENHFDAIFAVSSYYLNAFLPDLFDLLSLYCRIWHVPLVSHFAGGSHEFLIPLRKEIKKQAIRSSARIICGSLSEVDVLSRIFGVDMAKIVYMLNPVDIGVFSEMSKEFAANKLNKELNKRYILFVGQLVKQKGVYDLIYVFQKLTEKYPEAQLLFVGYGPEKGKMTKLIHNLGIEDSVSFEGLVFHDILRYYYNLADAFVLPSYSEGLSNVVLESVACNVPTVATTVGGIPDILTDDVGLLVHPGDRLALYKNIEKVLDGTFKVNQEKRRILIEQFSLEHVEKNLREIFSEVVGHISAT